jgi:rhamnulokinase
VHYRDARNNGMCDESFRLIDKDTFYEITGNQFMDINTAFQLLSLRRNQPDVLERTETMLFTPDLLNYFLTRI